MSNGFISTLRDLKRPEGTRLFGLVDGARALPLAAAASQNGSQIYSLFEGESASDLWEVAPYVFAVDPEEPILEAWAPWAGQNPGILLLAKGDAEALQKELRKLFVVADEEGQEFFFRFYDPRVLRKLMPTCSAKQLAELFAAIEVFLTETEDGIGVIRYRLERDQLIAETLPLKTETPAGETR